jgi:hypothetical protein
MIQAASGRRNNPLLAGKAPVLHFTPDFEILLVDVYAT